MASDALDGISPHLAAAPVRYASSVRFFRQASKSCRSPFHPAQQLKGRLRAESERSAFRDRSRKLLFRSRPSAVEYTALPHRSRPAALWRVNRSWKFPAASGGPFFIGLRGPGHNSEAIATVATPKRVIDVCAFAFSRFASGATGLMLTTSFNPLGSRRLSIGSSALYLRFR